MMNSSAPAGLRHPVTTSRMRGCAVPSHTGMPRQIWGLWWPLFLECCGSQCKVCQDTSVSLTTIAFRWLTWDWAASQKPDNIPLMTFKSSIFFKKRKTCTSSSFRSKAITLNNDGSYGEWPSGWRRAYLLKNLKKSYYWIQTKTPRGPQKRNGGICMVTEEKNIRKWEKKKTQSSSCLYINK